MQMPRLRSFFLASVFVVLGALIAFAMQRELMPRSANVPPASATDAATSPPIALSAEEETYAAALWPIHSGVVEVSAVEMSFAGIDYVTEHPDRERLGARALKLNDVFRGAVASASGLDVPRSMRTVHDQYMEALTLYVS